MTKTLHHSKAQNWTASQTNPARPVHGTRRPPRLFSNTEHTRALPDSLRGAALPDASCTKASSNPPPRLIPLMNAGAKPSTISKPDAATRRRIHLTKRVHCMQTESIQCVKTNVMHRVNE